MKIADSRRLRFGMITAEDHQLLFDLDQDPEVMRFINGGRPTTMKQVIHNAIPRLKKYHNPALGWGIWKTEDIESGDYIGWVLIRPMNFFTEARNNRDIEVGWRFKRHSWGNGFATEAARAIMESVEALGNTDSFSAIADPRNAASIRVMEKLGMKFVKQYVHVDPSFTAECVLYRRDVNPSSRFT